MMRVTRAVGKLSIWVLFLLGIFVALLPIGKALSDSWWRTALLIVFGGLLGSIVLPWSYRHALGYWFQAGLGGIRLLGILFIARGIHGILWASQNKLPWQLWRLGGQGGDPVNWITPIAIGIGVLAACFLVPQDIRRIRDLFPTIFRNAGVGSLLTLLVYGMLFGPMHQGWLLVSLGLLMSSIVFRPGTLETWDFTPRPQPLGVEGAQIDGADWP